MLAGDFHSYVIVICLEVTRDTNRGDFCGGGFLENGEIYMKGQSIVQCLLDFSTLVPPLYSNLQLPTMLLEIDHYCHINTM